MNRLNICPSTLKEGYDTYSPSVIRSLFEGRKISHIFAGVSPEDESEEGDIAVKNAGRISQKDLMSILMGSTNRKILPLFSATAKTTVEPIINTTRQVTRNVPG